MTTPDPHLPLPDQSPAALRALFHSMADGAFLVEAGPGASGRILACNAALAEWLDLPPEEVHGLPVQSLFDRCLALAEDPASLRRDLQTALEQIAEQPVIYLPLHRPRARLLQLQLFPVAGAAGGPPGWGGLVRDLARADEINLLGAVLHELRTPMAAIKGYVTTLLDNFRRWDPAIVEEFLQTINESTDQLSGLVENMLDMSRLESGSLQLQRQPLNLPELVSQLVSEFELRSRRHRFHIQFPADFPLPLADRVRIDQVLRNLLQNAIKYAPAGGEIAISGHAGPGALTLRVRDEGIGVPAGERERIFERFYQAENAPEARSGGSGLGLYICHQVIEAHGGRIWVEDPEAGPGSVFAFELPLQPGPRPAPVTSAAPRPGSAQPSRPAGSLRILVAEDDRRLVRFVKANLEAGGYQVLTAPDGLSALEAAEREPPDLLLLDINLPQIDGFTLCARVREFSQAPIVMLTARTAEADLVHALDLGADDYLTKPFGAGELLARVRAVLRRSHLPPGVHALPVITRGQLAIDFARRQVSLRGQPLNLTPTEYRLLYHLASNAGQVLTHEQLLRKVWGSGYEAESAYLWVYISRLRKKIEAEPDSPRVILTEAGVGYRFSPQ